MEQAHRFKTLLTDEDNLFTPPTKGAEHESALQDSPGSGGLRPVAIAFWVHLPLARAAAFFWATSAKSIFLACTISLVAFFTSAHLLVLKIAHSLLLARPKINPLEGQFLGFVEL